MPLQKGRKLVAIMFTDIVGYSALMQEDETAAIQIRTRHRQVFEEQHDQYSGKIIQYYGDGSLSIFESAIQAVLCAIEIQQQLKQKPPIVPLRIGIHMGDIVHTDTEVYGDSVNIASRIESMSIAGGILISRKVNDELNNHRTITSRSLGLFDFKNILQPTEIFAITNEGIAIPTAHQLKNQVLNPTKSIAVLPFVNMSSNAENAYFSDGMTEEIINALTKIKELKVTSRTSSFYFKNKQIPLSQIGRELRVATILEGSIRLSGNRMRITAQLIDVSNDSHFWSETFDRSLDDIFAVQDEISLIIASRLRQHLGYFEIEEHLVDAPKVPVEVYQQYLKSRYHVLKMSKPEIEEGLSILFQIIRQQPDFAMAHLGVHLGYTLLGTLGLLPAMEAFAKGRPFLDKAFSLAEDLPECQLHLAWISFLQHWDLAGTYRHLSKVYEIRPIVEYYQTMASTLVAERKFEAALNYIETAIQLDPFSDINHHLRGFIYYSQENYASAILEFEKNIALKADSRVSLQYWGQALLLSGRTHESLEFYKNLKVEPGDLIQIGGITLANAALGNTALAKAGIDTLEAALQTDSLERAMNMLILCETAMGNHEKALSYLEKGIAFRLPMIVYVSIEPLLKPLHVYPQYQELMLQVL